MKLSAKSLLLLVAVIAVFASCKKSVPKQLKFIPKDATLIFGVSPKNLHEKVAKSNISLDSIFNTFGKEVSDSSVTKMKNAIGDLKDAGLDLSEEVYLFAKIGGSIMNGKSGSLAVVALLKDPSKFEAYLKKYKPEASIKKESKYSYAALGNDFVAGWNSDVLIISMASGKDSPGTYSSGEGTLSQLQLTALYELKEEESAAAIPEFRDLVKETSDALFWTNTSGALDQVPMLGMTKVADLFKDAYTASTVNFNDGKIEAETKSYSAKALQEILKKHPGQDLDIDMVTKYPSSNIDGFVAYSFNPQTLIEILKFSGFEGQANQFIKDLGFTTDDVAKAFKGDMAIVVSDFSVQEKPNPYYPAMKMKEPKVKFIFDAKVGDKASFTKIMDVLASKGLVVKSGNEYKPMGVPPGIAYSIDDKDVLIGMDSALLLQYKAGSGKAVIPDDIKSKSKGQALSFYIDVNKLLQAVPLDSSAKAEEVALMTKAKGTFKDVSATSGHFDGKLSKSEFEFRMVDDKKNSLVSLMEFIAEAAKTAKAAKDANSVQLDEVAPPQVDSTLPVVPPAPEK